MKGWKQREGLLALLIGIILIAGIILAVIAFVPMSPFERNYSLEVDREDADAVRLTVEADVASVEIRFMDLGDRAVQADLDLEGRSGFLGGEPEVGLAMVNERFDDLLEVDVILSMDSGPTVSYERSELVITIDTGLRTTLYVTVDVGDVDLEVILPEELDGGSVQTKVGAVRADLGEGVSILSDLELRSKVGSVSLSCASPVLAEGVSVELLATTGSVSLDLSRTDSAGGNATFRCQTDTGSIDLDLTIIGNNSAEITSLAGVGDINTDLTGFVGMEVHLESDNFPDESNLTISLQSDVGSINIDADWSG